jgi:hypothetical protein
MEDSSSMVKGSEPSVAIPMPMSKADTAELKQKRSYQLRALVRPLLPRLLTS